MSVEDPLTVMALAYGVRRDTFEVAKAVRKSSASEHPAVLEAARLESFAQVVGIFGHNDPEEFDKFRNGRPLADWLRDMMVGMVAVYEGDPTRADEIVDTVLGDLATRLSEDAG